MTILALWIHLSTSLLLLVYNPKAIFFLPVNFCNYHILSCDSLLSIEPHFFKGYIYPPACIIYWMDFINKFVAGSKVHLFLLLKDAFGNTISSKNNEPNGSYFKVFSSYENGSIADQPDISHSGWNELGFFGLEFIPRTSGSLLLHVYGNNQSLSGTLTFIVKPGLLLHY